MHPLAGPLGIYPLFVAFATVQLLGCSTAILERHEKDLKDPSKKLRLDDMPVFTFRPEGTASRLERALPDLGILLLFNVAFFLGAFVSFLRYDVR